MELVSAHLKLVFEHIGESWGGDFDETDPGDEKLLRFSLYQKDHADPSGYTEIDNTSYCTALPAATAHRTLRLIGESMLAEFESTYVSSPLESLRALARFFSWVSPADAAFLGAVPSQPAPTQISP